MAGTLVPYVFSQWSDSNGAPLASGTIDVYAAGTLTRVTTYTDAALSVAHPNPIILDSAGRAVIFVSPTSLKLVLKTSAGVTVATIDNVLALAPFNVDTDIQGTFGEAVGQSEFVFQSDGTGGRTAGRYYKTDADTPSMSSTPPIVGISIDSVASGGVGAVRLKGRVTTGFSGLTPGAEYSLSGTPGAIVTPAPNAPRFIGVADSATSLVVTPVQGPSDLYVSTLTTTGAIAITGKTTLSGGLVIKGDQAVVLAAGGTNNQTLNAGVARLMVTSGAGGSTLTGLTGGEDGRELRVFNYGAAETLTISAESGSSTAANRFGNASTFAAGAVGIFHYSADRWWRIS